jgi:BirA family biotin operon repressor/biotin-[acetyl-CoA-carboxylase] ligase
VSLDQVALDQAAVARAAAERRAFGKRFELHEELPSTNDRARDLAKAGAPEGTLVIARRQSGGRGRLGRGWASPPGGLYLSLVLRPDEGMLKRAPISLVAGLAASEALDGAGRVATTLKWPNDVLLDGKKVAGILADLWREGTDPVLVLGVGLNVDTDPAQLPPEVRAIATSLRAKRGAPVSLEDALRLFLSHLEGHYESVRRGGGPLLLARAADRMAMLGTRVRVRLPDRLLEGTASGLNATGALVVALDDGKREVVYAGDVEEVRPA